MTEGPGSFVLYDGECPVCSAYVAMSQLRRLQPDIEVLDARVSPGLVARLRAEGFDVNESLLVRVRGRTFAGAEAMRLIFELGSENPLMRRAALYAIGGAPWAGVLYPWLRAIRNLLLRMLGRKQI